MIDCRRCDMRGVAGEACVLAALVPQASARHLEAEELRALSVLADAGLVPPLCLRATSGATGPASGPAPATLPMSGNVPAARTWAFPATKAS
jgi:hypothetical protein